MTTGMHLVSGGLFKLALAARQLPEPEASGQNTQNTQNTPVRQWHLSGTSLFADIFCVSCCSCVGWRYVSVPANLHRCKLQRGCDTAAVAKDGPWRWRVACAQPLFSNPLGGLPLELGSGWPWSTPPALMGRGSRLKLAI